MADVESFNSTILSLEGQSKNCKVCCHTVLLGMLAVYLCLGMLAVC